MDIFMNLLLIVFIFFKIILYLNTHFNYYEKLYSFLDYNNAQKLRFNGSISEYLLDVNNKFPPRSDYAGLNNFQKIPLSVCALIEDLDIKEVKEFDKQCY